MGGDLDERSKTQASQTLVCQIIAGALIMGVVTFSAILVVLRSSGGKGLFAADPWDLAPGRAIISLMAVGMAVTMMVMSFVVPKIVTKDARRRIGKGEYPKGPDGSPMAKDVEGAFRMSYPIPMIIGLAMLEGAAFFCLIAFLLEGRIPTLIAAGVLVLTMVSRFPTRGAIDRFVEDQSAMILEDRISD